MFVIMGSVWCVALTLVCGCKEPRLERGNVRNTLTVHAGFGFHFLACTNFQLLLLHVVFSGDKDRCFCIDGDCVTEEWECHGDLDCQDQAKCAGKQCTCQGWCSTVHPVKNKYVPFVL